MRLTAPPAVQLAQIVRLPGAERVRAPAVVIPPVERLPVPTEMLKGVPVPLTQPMMSLMSTLTALAPPLKLTKVEAEIEPLAGPPVTVMAPAAAWLKRTFAAVELSCDPAPMLTVRAPPTALLLMSRFPVDAVTMPFWVKVGVVRVTDVPDTVAPEPVDID